MEEIKHNSPFARCGEGKRVLVGMSGGVDSSVAAWLLREQGYEVVGTTFKLWNEPTRDTKCCSIDDVRDARFVCHQLGLPHYMFNYEQLFRKQVVDAFAREYASGRTPNPCILCNRYIKFEEFCRRARELGFDHIATGHYARVQQAPSGRWELLRGIHAPKDQSYVLYPATQEQLSMLLLPLGGYAKDEIRQMAQKQGLVVAQKPDSQDICFVPDGDHGAFLQRYTGKALTPGNFVDKEGRILGPHKGLQCYTLGQRKGLGISLGRTMYVSQIHPQGDITLVEEEEDLLDSQVLVGTVNWVSIPQPDAPIEAQVKLRYAHQAAPAVITPLEGNRAAVLFDQPQRAATPGQAAVFYQGDRVLGGGVIEPKALLP